MSREPFTPTQDRSDLDSCFHPLGADLRVLVARDCTLSCSMVRIVVEQLKLPNLERLSLQSCHLLGFAPISDQLLNPFKLPKLRSLALDLSAGDTYAFAGLVDESAALLSPMYANIDTLTIAPVSFGGPRVMEIPSTAATDLAKHIQSATRLKHLNVPCNLLTFDLLKALPCKLETLRIGIIHPSEMGALTYDNAGSRSCATLYNAFVSYSPNYVQIKSLKHVYCYSGWVLEDPPVFAALSEYLESKKITYVSLHQAEQRVIADRARVEHAQAAHRQLHVERSFRWRLRLRRWNPVRAAYHREPARPVDVILGSYRG